MNLSKRSKTTLVWVSFLLVFVIFFFRLDAIGLTGPDEPRYAEVAKEMFLTRDYITPRIHGTPWLEKPVFYYWCAAAFYSLLGVNETAARLPSAISAFLLIIGVLAIPRKSLHPEIRWLGAMVLATNLGVIAFSHAVAMDMMLTASMSIAMIIFLEALLAPEPSLSIGWLVLAYLALGISALVKGPVGILLTALILIGYFGASGRWDTARRLRIPLGILVLTVTVLPWYFFCYRANGWTFIDTFLIQHNVERFVTSEFRHNQPYWFYLPILFYGMLPWSSFLVLPLAHIKHLLRSFRERKSPELIFLSLWMVIPFLFFTVSNSKLPGYILPILVPLALLIGHLCGESDEEFTRPHQRNVMKWVLAGEVLIVVLLYLYHSRIERSFRVTLPSFRWWLATIAVVSILVLMCCLLSKQPVHLLTGYHLLLITTLAVAANLNILPRLDEGLSVRPVARLIQAASPTPTLFLFRLPRDLHYGFDFYLSTLPIPVDSLEELDDKRSTGVIYLALPVSELADQQRYLEEGAQEIFASRRFKVFRLGQAPKRGSTPFPPWP